MINVLKGKLSAPNVSDSSAPVELRFDLTNGDEQDLYVLKWYTPLEGLNSDCLKVLRNGKTKVAYDGPMVKRGNPGPADYILIPAGQTVTSQVDVSGSYAVSIPADYAVELNVPALEHIPAPPAPEKGAVSATAKSAAVSNAKRSPRTQALKGGKVRFKVGKGTVQIPTRGKAARKLSQTSAKAKVASSSAGASGTAAPLAPNSHRRNSRSANSGQESPRGWL